MSSRDPTERADRPKSAIFRTGWSAKDIPLWSWASNVPNWWERPLAEAMHGNTLNALTLNLFYATDFADQLERVILPSLKAGFVVLADRYIYTLMARDIVRGSSMDWLREIYGFALVPDAVFYLNISPKILAERNFQKRGIPGLLGIGHGHPKSRGNVRQLHQVSEPAPQGFPNLAKGIWFSERTRKPFASFHRQGDKGTGGKDIGVQR